MSNNKWQALSMKDRAFLIREAVRNGITDMDYIRNLYNENGDRIKLGTPYRTFESGSDYDYFNAAPENIPQENDGHWSSRNPHTGQLLKSPNHPTYDLAVEGEKAAGYEIHKRGDREYSLPKNHKFSGLENGWWNTVKDWFTADEPQREAGGKVDLDELKKRQAWAESRFRDNAVSPAGATGRFQIMPGVQKDYIKAGGRRGNLKDPKYNEEVRDWQMEQLAKRSWINKENSSDSVKVGKQLAAYNWGPTNTVKALNKAKEAGIDIYKSFDWVNEEYFPKETVDYINWTLRNKTTGVHRNDSIYSLNKHKYSGEEPVEIPAITVMPKIKRKISDAYYHLFRTPKDYCKEHTDIDNCAEWSNKQLQKRGKSIFGHAWTRSANKNLDKVISGYDVKSKPGTYDVDKVRSYLFEAADKVKADINIKELQDGDIVGMFFRGSPSQEQAWREGVKGEVHTHTGHIELNERGKPFVVHNVHKDIRKNKVKKVLGSNRPYGITSIYRPK